MTLRRRDFDPAIRGPLNGVRVLDLTRLVSGNTLTMTLADLGADVIKIEPPKGDTLRAWRIEGIETNWKVLARNKKSICLDLRAPQAKDIIKRLAANASILAESFRPGTLENMGLGPEVLHAINPKLVIVRISGFGQGGPYRNRPGFGSLVEGMSGLAASTGYPDNPPLLPNFALADSVAAYAGAVSALVALRHAESPNGSGQVVDVPLFNPLFGILGPQAADYKLSGRPRQRNGSRMPNSIPRGVYQTRDKKWVSVTTAVQSMAERLFHAIGRSDLATDPNYATFEQRAARADELDGVMQDFIGKLTQTEVMDLFEKAEVTVAPVGDVSDLLNDPHVIDREIIVDVPDEELGSFPMNGFPTYLSKTPSNFYRPAPKKGAHNEEVLASIGISGAELEALEKAGVVVPATSASKQEKDGTTGQRLAVAS